MIQSSVVHMLRGLMPLCPATLWKAYVTDKWKEVTCTRCLQLKKHSNE